MKNTFPLSCVFHLLAAIFLVASVSSPATASSTRAKYQSIKHNKVVFLVMVGHPAPSSLIVEHFHPRNIQLVTASPRADKINNENGVSKWFLKNVHTGVYPFSLSFNSDVSPGSLKVVLRYNDPATGTFHEIAAQP